MQNQTSDKQLPLTRIQKLIGGYMLQSKRTKASAYLGMRADLTDLVAMRKDYCRQVKVRVTTNDFFIYAIAQAAKDYPLMTATIDRSGEFLLTPENIGIGFAVAAPQGLVVPVIQKMNQKTLPQTADDSEILLKKARSNKLRPEDFDGANIVLTGLGMYGIDSFYAISPPSATAIISIGNFDEMMIPINGGYVRRKMMHVAMAFDQRVIDEFYAAGFLKKMIRLLECPEELTR